VVWLRFSEMLRTRTIARSLLAVSACLSSWQAAAAFSVPLRSRPELLNYGVAGKRGLGVAGWGVCGRIPRNHLWGLRSLHSAEKGPKQKKRKIGELLVEQGLARDAKHASALIMAGSVISGESNLVKSAAEKVKLDTPLRLKGQKGHSWVSRGGLKLSHAVERFDVSVKDAVAIDVGCSTGGFTDVLLHNGAAKVYAVDVGYGQLAMKLRQDERVVILERTNARVLDRDLIPDAPSVVVCDASFISLKTVLPAALRLCQPPATLLALIKPQFEAKQAEVEDGTGVVRDEAVRKRVCDEIWSWLETVGWEPKGIVPSSILGPSGNQEFIIYAMLSSPMPEPENS